MKGTSHVYDSVMRICLVHLLPEQVHCHLYISCNELLVKNGTLPPHNSTVDITRAQMMLKS